MFIIFMTILILNIDTKPTDTSYIPTSIVPGQNDRFLKKSYCFLLFLYNFNYKLGKSIKIKR